jgi:uroporphyrin-III C-methyltransferase/precorrin-2 dehydrogenase/sirohydrochlorin ferrochelatase
MTLASLPIFVRLEGRPVILLGVGEAADAKRRLLERAGAIVVGEDQPAALAVVALDDEAEAVAAVERLRARDVLVNAVDRSALCDFTLPAIVDRAPVIVAIGTGGVSAGLAAALRQRLEALLPPTLGGLAHALHGARAALRIRFPDARDRRQAIAAALAPGAWLDPLRTYTGEDVFHLIESGAATSGRAVIRLGSRDPDDLTLRQARLLANADVVAHTPDVPVTILNRARADATRIIAPAPDDPAPGLTVEVSMQ